MTTHEIFLCNPAFVIIDEAFQRVLFNLIVPSMKQSLFSWPNRPSE